MSVTFSIVGEPPHCDEFCDECRAQTVNMSNANARDLLAALGLDSHDLYGQARACELVGRLERLAAVTDPGIEGYRDGNFVMCGRREGYLQGRARDLLVLCSRAGELGTIAWG